MGGFFIKSIIISFVLDTFMFKMESLQQALKPSNTMIVNMVNGTGFIAI